MAVQRRVHHHGAEHDGPAAAPQLALAQLGLGVNQAATPMGALDYFVMVALLAAACVAAVALEGAWRAVLKAR